VCDSIVRPFMGGADAATLILVRTQPANWIGPTAGNFDLSTKLAYLTEAITRSASWHEHIVVAAICP
jgi:hypothetical protein